MIHFMGSNKYIIRKIKSWPVFKQDPALVDKKEVTSSFLNFGHNINRMGRQFAKSFLALLGKALKQRASGFVFLHWFLCLSSRLSSYCYSALETFVLLGKQIL